MKLTFLLTAFLFVIGEIHAADKIVVGMVNAQTGASAALGIGVKKGALAYINRINKEGINGKKIELNAFDDGYEPARTVSMTERLVNDIKAFVLFGYVGTPTSQAVLPLVEKNNIPYIAPFTGAESLRNPVNKNVFNVRASYFDETEMLVNHLMDDKGAKKIAIFIQDDGYGAAGEAGVLRALKARGAELAGKGTYARNTTEIDAGFESVKKAAPDAVIMIGTYRACAAFVKKAKASGLNVPFANVSFVGTSALIKELGNDAEGVIISQVFPSPFDASIPLVKEYQADMLASGESQFDYTSIEGYVGARVLAEALKVSSDDRDKLRSGLENMNADIVGFKVSFSPTNHSGSKATYLTVVKNNKPVQVNKL